VTAGCGLVQRSDDPVEQIRPGDVIWIPSGENHWHGATATTAMTHIAIQEQLDGKTGRLDGKGQSRTIPGGVVKIISDMARRPHTHSFGDERMKDEFLDILI
jgi:hypothetical protein